MNGNVNNNQQKQWYLHTFAVKTEDKAKIGAYLKQILAPGEQYAYINWNNSEYRYQVHTTKQNIGILGNITTQKSSANSKTFKQTASYKNAVVFTQPSQVMNNAIDNNINIQNKVNQNQMQVNKNKINIGNNKIVSGGNAKNVVQKKQDIENPIKNKQDSEHEKDSVEPDFLYLTSDGKLYAGTLLSEHAAVMELANKALAAKYTKKCCMAGGNRLKYTVITSNPDRMEQVNCLLNGIYQRIPGPVSSSYILENKFYQKRYNEIYNSFKNQKKSVAQSVINNQIILNEIAEALRSR